jgi:hypothetical protein
MTKYAGATVAVAIYQASQSAYDVRYFVCIDTRISADLVVLGL